jgi:hypothetical protein
MNTRIFSPNKTSAKFLIEFAHEKFMSKEDPDTNAIDRFAIMYDLFIKARSWGIINKICFWFAIILGMMVLLWPSIAVISKDFGFDKEFLKSAVIQTTITGLAAIMSAAYSFYKKRQLHIENLMRFVLFGNENIVELRKKVTQELGRIDTGFGGFSRIAIDKNKSKDESKLID